MTLADPGNPSGAGDDIVITILDPNGNGTDAYGTLSGKGLTSDGYGSYEVSPTTSVMALQTELSSLVFTAGMQAPGTGPIKLTFDLDVQADNGGATDNQLASVDIMSAAIACYCQGTLILTDKGEVAVEELAIGQVVVTATGANRPIRWIGRRSYVGRFLAANPRVHPVRFQAGSLGGGLPRRDLLVSPEHAMFLDGVLVPAHLLTTGGTIVREHGLERVDYVHVELNAHDVLLAEGAASESFLDDDSRGAFHNASEFALLYPDAPGAGDFCAPRVTEGYQLEAIRQRLAGADALRVA